MGINMGIYFACNMGIKLGIAFRHRMGVNMGIKNTAQNMCRIILPMTISDSGLRF